jgi:hypothetical protein
LVDTPILTANEARETLVGSSCFELVTVNTRGVARRKTLHGRQYLVVDATILREGVLNGSRGPLYYPPDEISANPGVWNHVPIVAWHPKDKDGNPTLARHPEVLEEYGLGVLFNDQYDPEHATRNVEAWFDEARTENFDRRLKPEHKILPRLRKGQPIELSTGLFTDNIPGVGTFNTQDGRAKSYSHIARNYRPDHLAALPDQLGACSVRDGCGFNVNASPKTDWKKIGDELAGKGLMPGYGQIFLNDEDERPGDRVWYVGGDGDEDGFSKIVEQTLKSTGAKEVIYEAESFPPKDQSWVQVYPKQRAWVTPKEVVNANPEGCNQYTGAGCSTAQHTGNDVSHARLNAAAAATRAILASGHAQSLHSDAGSFDASAKAQKLGKRALAGAMAAHQQKGGTSSHAMEAAEAHIAAASKHGVLAVRLGVDGLAGKAHQTAAELHGLAAHRFKHSAHTMKLVGNMNEPDNTTALGRLIASVWNSVSGSHQAAQVVNKDKRQPSTSLDMTPQKACRILHDGEANGHPLTEKQRGMFGALCGKMTKNAQGEDEWEDGEGFDWQVHLIENGYTVEDVLGLNDLISPTENAKKSNLTGGHWVTTEGGQHIYVSGGKVVAGNPHAMGGAKAGVSTDDKIPKVSKTKIRDHEQKAESLHREAVKARAEGDTERARNLTAAAIGYHKVAKHLEDSNHSAAQAVLEKAMEFESGKAKLSPKKTHNDAGDYVENEDEGEAPLINAMYDALVVNASSELDDTGSISEYSKNCPLCGGSMNGNKCTECAYVDAVTNEGGKCPVCGKTMKKGKCPECGYDPTQFPATDRPSDTRNTAKKCTMCGGKMKDGKCSECGHESKTAYGEMKEHDGSATYNEEVDSVTNSEDPDMATKVENVRYLTTNCECWKGKEAALNAMSEAELESWRKYHEKATKNEQVINSLPDYGITVNSQGQVEKSWAGTVDFKDAAVRDQVCKDLFGVTANEAQVGFAFAKKIEQEQRFKLVHRLTANISNDKEREARARDLLQRPTGDLELLVSLLPPKPDEKVVTRPVVNLDASGKPDEYQSFIQSFYSGGSREGAQGAPFPILNRGHHDDREDAPDVDDNPRAMPTMNYDELSPTGVKLRKVRNG